MYDTMQETLIAHIENVGDFEVEMGDDGVGGTHYGSSYSFDSRPYCDVRCEGIAGLTFTVPADEVDDELVAGYSFTVTVRGPRDANVKVAATVKDISVSAAKDDNVTVNAVICYDGKGLGSTDRNWGCEPND